MRVFVVDSLVGNDYSLCLCKGLEENDLKVELISVKGRKSPFEITFPLRRWAPEKKTGQSKVKKSIGYFIYLARVFNHIHRQKKKSNVVVHFQFFRRERVEAVFLLLLRLTGIRLVFTAHNILPHEAVRADRILRSIIFRSVHVIIVHSSYVKQSLLEAFAMPEEKVKIVPHGNFDHYLPKESYGKQQARSRLGLEMNDHVLLFFGYIREYKGLDLLLEAFEEAAKKDPRLKLLIAGAPHSTELEQRTRSTIERSEVKDRIIFHGHFIAHEAIKHYFIGADVVVLPYKHIYHSGIVHLAYSYGKPVIVTQVGDFSETVEHGKSGFILHENTAPALAQCLVQSFLLETELEEMGEYAKQLSETLYSWVDIGRKTSLVYTSLCR